MAIRPSISNLKIPRGAGPKVGSDFLFGAACLSILVVLGVILYANRDKPAE